MVPIEDGMTVYAAVTVHDLRGNVHLDGLTTDSAVAIDNLADREAPDRIEELVATDRPEDDGRAVLLEFLPSTASDVESYEVYVLSAPFNRVSETHLQAWCSIVRPTSPSWLTVIRTAAPLSPTSPFISLSWCVTRAATHT